ncbi:hypothetical protein GCM10022291_20380 [Postechiella marina]|uniref:Peptidase M56 domain-containing protein n=1 Tax=Postechiella marina TaxID=943941 RepID=A0ABP8C9Y5_9FLAO
MIIVSKYLVPRGYLGLTIFPFVFLKRKALRHNAVLINHERIHLKQQLELFILPFYVFYSVEFFVKFMVYRHWHLAYKNISFEREAYANESNFHYLKQRRFWNFLKYIRINDFSVKQEHKRTH